MELEGVIFYKHNVLYGQASLSLYVFSCVQRLRTERSLTAIYTAKSYSAYRFCHTSAIL